MFSCHLLDSFKRGGESASSMVLGMGDSSDAGGVFWVSGSLANWGSLPNQDWHMPDAESYYQERLNPELSRLRRQESREGTHVLGIQSHQLKLVVEPQRGKPAPFPRRVLRIWRFGLVVRLRNRNPSWVVEDERNFVSAVGQKQRHHAGREYVGELGIMDCACRALTHGRNAHALMRLSMRMDCAAVVLKWRTSKICQTQIRCGDVRWIDRRIQTLNERFTARRESESGRFPRRKSGECMGISAPLARTDFCGSRISESPTKLDPKTGAMGDIPRSQLRYCNRLVTRDSHFGWSQVYELCEMRR
jgi:hypothetical protein